MSSNVVHALTIGNELQRIFDTDLKSALNLKSVVLNDISFLPAQILTTMIPGIFIAPSPATSNEPTELPRVLYQKYFFRIIYIRKMKAGENPTTQGMSEMATIVNKLTDKIQLPDVTNLPDNAQILWMMWRSIEWHPPEDNLVAAISAEMTAMAVNLEVNVRTVRAAV